jgi:uncharacterized protein
MQFALMGTVLLMGFLGSWHCGVMCGPLVCNFRKKDDFLSYQIGRLISYLILGSLLFYGFHFFKDVESRGLKMLSGVVFEIILIFFGLNQIHLFQTKKLQFRFYKIQMKFVERFKSISKRFPIVLGLLTGLFPCAWLYSFLLLSSQLATLDSALLVIFVFWLSSLPAFIVVAGFMNKLIRNSPISYQNISAFVLIAAGLFSIFGHWAQIILN